MIATILAGGEGRRFRPYTEILPKPMIPVGPEEQPILEHILRWLARHGIKDFVFLVGYRWKQIRNYFRDGSYWGVNIRYSIDSEDYRGTGGALLNAYRKGLLDADTVLVWYGDILAPINVGDLLDKHVSARADATIALAQQYQVPVGVAKVDPEGNIVELKEKPWLQLHVTIGVLTLNPGVLERAENFLGRSFDIMGDLVPWMIRNGMHVKAYTYRGLWFDIGSLERYNKLDHAMIKEFLDLE